MSTVAIPQPDSSQQQQPVRMVAPDGTVLDINPTPGNLAIAQAHKMVPYGSPQHMAMLGVAGPGKMPPAPNPITSNPDAGYSPMLEGAQPFIGAGREVISQAANIFDMARRAGIPLNAANIAKMKQAGESNTLSTDGGTGQRIGRLGLDVGEMFAPVGVASKVEEALPVAQKMLPLTRNAAGQFMKARYAPVVSDMIAQKLAKLGTQAVGTGAVTAAQGGDFSKGAAAGALGGAANEAVSAVAPSVRAAIANSPTARSVLAKLAYGAGLGGAYEVGSGHVHPRMAAELLAGAGGLAALRNPAIRTVAPALLLDPRIRALLGEQPQQQQSQPSPY